LGRDQDVRWLDVAMQLASCVQHRYAISELTERADESFAREMFASLSTHIPDEAHTPHAFHREERSLIIDEQLVQADQVRMCDVGQAAELALQSIEVGGATPAQRFQRHHLVSESVVHFVD